MATVLELKSAMQKTVGIKGYSKLKKQLLQKLSSFDEKNNFQIFQRKKLKK